MSTESDAILTTIVRLLNDNEVPAEKVVLHKFIYFLDTQGLNLGFSFEPYTYGPFSFDLAKRLNHLVFFDFIDEENSSYTTTDKAEGFNVDDELHDELSEMLDAFCEAADNDFSFNNMEIIGTILYCAESLIYSGEEPNFNNIYDEFVAWKQDKYQKAVVFETYSRLTQYIGNIQ